MKTVTLMTKLGSFPTDLLNGARAHVAHEPEIEQECHRASARESGSYPPRGRQSHIFRRRSQTSRLSENAGWKASPRRLASNLSVIIVLCAIVAALWVFVGLWQLFVDFPLHIIAALSWRRGSKWSYLLRRNHALEEIDAEGRILVQTANGPEWISYDSSLGWAERVRVGRQRIG
jgi:hypothetical protein